MPHNLQRVDKLIRVQEQLLILKNKSESFLGRKKAPEEIKKAEQVPAENPLIQKISEIIANKIETPEAKNHARNLLQLTINYTKRNVDKKPFEGLYQSMSEKISVEDLNKIQEPLSLLKNQFESVNREKNARDDRARKNVLESGLQKLFESRNIKLENLNVKKCLRHCFQLDQDYKTEKIDKETYDERFKNITKKLSNQDLLEVQKHLRMLAEYYENLEEKNNKNPKNRAADAAMAIYNNLNQLYTDYVEETIDLSTFQMKAKAILSNENAEVKELKKHRGYKEILVNLAAAIASLGLTLIISAAMGKGLTLFSVDTDSGKILKDLENEVKTTNEGPQTQS